jgi:hypothetical protein
VLEFDHVADKTMAVSKHLLRGHPWETIEAEIANCEVVCVNRHKRRTQRRAGSVRTRW